MGQGVVTPHVLESDLDVGSDSGPFDVIGDVAAFPDGRLAVLDAGTDEVIVLSPHGHVISRFGRVGDGPGEFRSPIAILVLGDRIVVIQADPYRTFTAFDTTGRVAATAGAPVSGDWQAMVSHGPRLPVDDWARSASQSEDVTRRFGVTDDADMLVQLQPDDLDQRSATRSQRLPAHLLRFDDRFRLIDTLVGFLGIETVPDRVVMAGAVRHPAVPLFARRPVWASGRGWLAVGSSEDTSVSILTHDSTVVVAAVAWPHGANEVSQADRMDVARWTGDYTLRYVPSARAAANAMSHKDIDRMLQAQAARLPFATREPELMAMYGAGSCLWLFGFAPADYIDGTAHTAVILDVRKGRLVDVVRVPRRDGRIRAVDLTGVYVTYRDSLNVYHLERYPAAYRSCNGESQS